MRNFSCLASFCILMMFAGCSKSSDASQRKTSKPGADGPPVCDHGSKELPPVFADPSGHTASSMPSADLKVFDRVGVHVEGVEFLSDPQRGLDFYSDLQLLAVQVRVSSQLESLRIRVGPDRFTLETDKRPSTPAEPTCSKDPPLQKEYIKGGDTVVGWVAFVVPKGISKATLRTDLRKPFIAIPLSLPGSPSGPSPFAEGSVQDRLQASKDAEKK
jgi:hypothetical protein